MRVFISGQKHFGAEIFRVCCQLGIEIVGVSSPPFKENSKCPDRLRDIASRHNVPWIPAGTLNAETLPENIDLIIAAHSHDFIGQRTRLKAKLGAIGYHPSLLPMHRGRDAVRWAIKMGDKITGGSVFWLNENVDGGAIAAQGWCFIRPGDNAEELWRRDLAPLGVKLFRKVLQDLLAGNIIAVPQDESLATWEPSIGRPPLHRPDLLMIGSGGLENYRVTTDKNATHI